MWPAVSYTTQAKSKNAPDRFSSPACDKGFVMILGKTINMMQAWKHGKIIQNNDLFGHKMKHDMFKLLNPMHKHTNAFVQCSLKRDGINKTMTKGGEELKKVWKKGGERVSSNTRSCSASLQLLIIGTDSWLITWQCCKQHSDLISALEGLCDLTRPVVED